MKKMPAASRLHPGPVSARQKIRNGMIAIRSRLSRLGMPGMATSLIVCAEAGAVQSAPDYEGTAAGSGSPNSANWLPRGRLPRASG